MKVYLAQLKCPQNHCIMALAGLYGSLEAAQALEPMIEEWKEALFRSGVLNLECGLCKATVLHVEITPTIFQTLEEFQPAARAEEKRQLMIAQMLRQSKN
jgi:hypothetical protein